MALLAIAEQPIEAQVEPLYKKEGSLYDPNPL
jgi:hypothetical protein